MASADWNRDGRIDFAVHDLGNHKIRMWENVTVNSNHWVEIELQGIVSNSQAVGSWVAVYCDHPSSPFRTYTALGEDYLSQSESALHFGLAEVTSIDSVVVTWPTGTSETWNGLDVDQLHTLTEGEAAALNPCPNLGGSCQGCTYSEACNFEPEALIDDGSCFLIALSTVRVAVREPFGTPWLRFALSLMTAPPTSIQTESPTFLIYSGSWPTLA